MLKTKGTSAVHEGLLARKVYLDSFELTGYRWILERYNKIFSNGLSCGNSKLLFVVRVGLFERGSNKDIPILVKNMSLV
jgi:hypothetical protein